ncbi:hypothetical protein XELAEV_18014629mg, partial [Xenopus laevis]
QGARWRNHSILENLDELDSPRPDKFKKMPSSSSLNTLRMTLRKWMPLKEVKTNTNTMPNWDNMTPGKKQRSLQSMTITAKSVFGAMSQKITKTTQAKTYLLASPKQVKVSKRQIETPESSKKGSTPKRCNMPKKCDLSPLKQEGKVRLRSSSRAAALKSPYSSPVAIITRRQFDKDLEAISTGIRQLKRLSRVFDDAILKEERKEAIHSLMANNLRCTGGSRPSSRRSTRKLQHTL